MSKTYAVILAAGTGTRSKLQENKIFFKINNIHIIFHSINKFMEAGINNIVIVANTNDIEKLTSLINDTYKTNNIKIIEGGATRQLSSFKALIFLKTLNCNKVLIHDAARPFITSNLITILLNSLKDHPAIIPAIHTVDTIAIANMADSTIDSYLDRQNLINIQTPQAFSYTMLLNAYLQLKNNLSAFTDDASIFKEVYGTVKYIDGDYNNKKLTNEYDFEKLLSHYRIGSGYDMHKLVENRKLVLGGIHIPFEKGLLGHSDADSLLHAITDAVLSAAQLNDIGHYFPNSDIKYNNIDSSILLKKALSLIKENNFTLVNITATILAEKPKMAPFLQAIESNIAKITNIPKEMIKINATTLEGLGFIGREEGIGAYANCLLKTM